MYPCICSGLFCNVSCPDHGPAFLASYIRDQVAHCTEDYSEPTVLFITRPNWIILTNDQIQIDCIWQGMRVQFIITGDPRVGFEVPY